MSERIRTIAVAVCRDGDRILVERGYDRARAAPFYRAIGGAVEFGESASDAVTREWREELGLTLVEPVLLGVLENRFTYEGRPGHEVVFVFRGDVAERWAYGVDELASTDASGAGHAAAWLPIEALRAGPVPLHPDGLLDLVAGAPPGRADGRAPAPRGRRSITLVAVVVRDYGEAIAWYTRALGFDLVEDSPREGGKRWVVVAPPAGGTALLLARAATPAQERRIGDQTGGRVFLFLETDDFARDHEAMRSRGVEFVEQPRHETYGTVAVFRDLYGNRWDLVQPDGGAATAVNAAERAGRAPEQPGD